VTTAAAPTAVPARILVVDDEAEIKELAAELLESRGYAVTTAASAEASTSSSPI
jgi:CheY-like chemotaxis protein